jgi:hypothetical protein
MPREAEGFKGRNNETGESGFDLTRSQQVGAIVLLAFLVALGAYRLLG